MLSGVWQRDFAAFRVTYPKPPEIRVWTELVSVLCHPPPAVKSPHEFGSFGMARALGGSRAR